MIVAALRPEMPSAGSRLPPQWRVDGDTIRVDDNGQLQTIRLIGLDTPESVDPRKPVQCFAHEASAHQQIFRTAEDNARTDESGLWSPNTCAA